MSTTCLPLQNQIFFIWCLWLVPFVSTKRCQRNKKQLKENFENIYDWFVSNKVSTQTGGDKIKSILFASKRKIKRIRKLNVNFNNIKTTLGDYTSWLCFRWYIAWGACELNPLMHYVIKFWGIMLKNIEEKKGKLKF